MRVLLITGLVLLVLGLVLVFGVYPFISSQVGAQIDRNIQGNLTSKILPPNGSITVPYTSNGKSIFILYYNSTPFPLSIAGVPPNTSSLTSSGAFLVISNGSGVLSILNNWSRPAQLNVSSIYYTPNVNPIIGYLILAGIPLIVVGIIVAILGFVRKR
ncbi:hypothetical protein GWK48_07500 [Metallosphaera tengchongensis]|uniref:Uncharacterized protein n=1 Tax=Metallosphaera tengchongensis TaxID=1532350 RepID=A0A6N0NX99_9CREN|nr:hypothetical protein [Metallosphaera tengchongensis]QKR00239.1 hypothetical protein GWK48_07500 [Metallosphaera tengchongensis]